MEIDSILISERGLDPEVQANIQQLAQKLYDNVGGSSIKCQY